MNSLSIFSSELDELWLANHEVVELVKSILKNNKAWYIPWDILNSSGNLWEYLDSWLPKETHHNIWYEVCISVLEILYQPEKDALTIKYNWELDSSKNEIKLAVWQSYMILRTSQKLFNWNIYTLAASDPLDDVILIEGASGLVV